MNIRWGILTFFGLCLGLLFVTGSLATSRAAGDPTPTPTIGPLLNNPTNTPLKFSINDRPTSTPEAPGDVPEVMLTLTAFNKDIQGTLENLPTPTDGPSAIVLNDKPHFLDFWASWCGPCIEMRPSVKEMEAKYGDRINFWEIDTDNRASRKLNFQYRVQFIPLVVLLDKNGKTVQTLEGYQTEEELEAAITALLATPAPTQTPAK